MQSDAIPVGWSMKQLRDVCDHKPGKHLPNDQFSPHGEYAVYGSNSVMGSCSAPLYEGPLTVLARIGSNCGAVRFSKDACWINNNASALVPRACVAPRWLHAVLSALDYTPFKRGSGQPFIGITDLLGADVRVPAAEEQRRIAAVLVALDDKIESNERRCELHAEMIDAMFSRHVLARDESSLADGSLMSIARFVNGGAFTKDATGTGRPVLRIKELNSGISNATVFNDLDAKDDNIASHHDLLFSWSGSLDVYRWYGPKALINQHIFKVLPLDGFPGWFVEGWIRHHLPEFRAIAKDKATTMGHIKREHLTQATVRIPPHEVIVGLDDVLSPLDQQIGFLAREATTLRAVRDELLPKLVSGEIRVSPDADERDAPTELAA